MVAENCVYGKKVEEIDARLRDVELLTNRLENTFATMVGQMTKGTEIAQKTAESVEELKRESQEQNATLREENLAQNMEVLKMIHGVTDEMRESVNNVAGTQALNTQVISWAKLIVACVVTGLITWGITKM